jgi:hypothetical protein
LKQAVPAGCYESWPCSVADRLPIRNSRLRRIAIQPLGPANR